MVTSCVNLLPYVATTRGLCTDVVDWQVFYLAVVRPEALHYTFQYRGDGDFE